ncbi:MAG TPA: hypothetical protein VG917_02765 [Patescibacteria group bacterium]|nr:hypothetical protein [Patescibacteria group bacterium]
MERHYGRVPDIRTARLRLSQKSGNSRSTVDENLSSKSEDIKEVLGSFGLGLLEVDDQLASEPNGEFNPEAYQRTIIASMFQAGSLYRESQNSIEVADFLNKRTSFLFDTKIPLRDYLVRQGYRKGSAQYKRWSLERYEDVEMGLKKVHTESINAVVRAGIRNIDELQSTTYDALVRTISSTGVYRLRMSEHTFEFVQHLLKPLD